MKDRTNKKWTEAEKEWMGYKRKLANFKKESVSLSKPPWEKEAEQIKKDKKKNQRGFTPLFFVPG